MSNDISLHFQVLQEAYLVFSSLQQKNIKKQYPIIYETVYLNNCFNFNFIQTQQQQSLHIIFDQIITFFHIDIIFSKFTFRIIKNLMRKNYQPTKINSKRFKRIFNTLFQYSDKEKETFRIAIEEDTNRIYSDNLLKNLNNQHLTINTDIKELMIFGPGIYLLFKFLKILIPLFAIMSVLSIVNLVLLTTGSYYTHNEMNTSTFEALMARTTLGNMDQSYHNVIPILNFISMVIFTAGIIYWRQRQPYEVLRCCKVKLLPSYYTVKLQKIPNGYSQCQLKDFLQQLIGPVKQIYSVKQFNDDLLHYKEISEIINDYKIERVKVDDNREERNCLNLLKLFNQFYYYYIKMNNTKNPKYQPAFAFITFTQVAHREMLLDIYQKKTFTCTNTEIDQKYQYKNQILQFEPCEMEPEGISWENITLSTKNAFLRTSFQIFLIVIALLVSITIVYLLAVAQSNFTNSQYKNYNLQQASKMKNQNIIKSSCISLSITDFIKNQSYCSQYQSLFIKVVLLQIFLPLIIAILKFIFIQIMKSLVSIRRHPTQIQKLQSQVLITFVFYFIVSGILQLVLNIEFVTSSESKISIHGFFTSIFQQIYGLLPQKNLFILQNDFTRQWFFQNSAKIILISLLSFNLSSFIDIIYSIIRKTVIQYLASKQQVVAQMNNYLKCQTIQIQFIYAFVLNIIFFTLMFGSVIPLLWVLGFISIVILYFIQKLIFVKYCQKPLIFSHSVNHLVTRLVLFGIVFSCAIAPVLLGGVIDQGSISQRYIRYLYYPILGGLILVYMFTKKYWLKCLTVVKQSVQKQTKRVNKRLPTIFSRIQQPNIKLPSYSMHQASTYQPILRVLYTMNSSERNRQTFMVNHHVDDFLTQIQQLDSQNSPFKNLIYDIKYDQNKYHKINSKFNSFGSNQKQVKNITKIYEQCRQIKQKHIKHKESKVKKHQNKQIAQFQVDSIIEEHSHQSDHQNQNTSRNLSNQEPKKQVLQNNHLHSNRSSHKK